MHNGANGQTDSAIWTIEDVNETMGARLPLVEFAYKADKNESTKVSPFETGGQWLSATFPVGLHEAAG